MNDVVVSSCTQTVDARDSLVAVKYAIGFRIDHAKNRGASFRVPPTRTRYNSKSTSNVILSYTSDGLQVSIVFLIKPVKVPGETKRSIESLGV